MHEQNGCGVIPHLWEPTLISQRALVLEHDANRKLDVLQELQIYLYTKDCPDRTKKDGGPGVGKSGTSEAGNSKLMELMNQIKSQ